MRIFRRPAHLNAFRGNVLDIRFRFRFPPFSDSIRFRRPVLLPAHRPAPPCIFPFLVSSTSRPSPRFSFRPAPACLFPSSLPSRRPVAAIIVPPALSWDGGDQDEAIRCDPLRRSPSCRYPLRFIGMPDSPRPSCRRAGSEADRESLIHAICVFVRFPCSEAICIYSFVESTNMYVSESDARYGDWGWKR